MTTRRRDRSNYGTVPERVARLLLEEPPADDAEALWMLIQHGSRLRALWAAYGAILLPIWARRHPGTRPRAWWRVEAPEARRRTDERLPQWPGPRGTHGAGEYESEAAYLDRLGLLQRGERARIPVEGWAPEVVAR
ncbi:hypothetical protein SAMN05421829_102331 [Aromatoleum tolulyticum]|uniref:Uncharacterized protein n=1 Tax=Aromatoleum tolulyticum TaxID=34027 RepID=A0A1N6Q3W1_9RHOO|nr:hypothetical protein SAMN05421829_102331 [Aromatoleum tolulyticum]